MNIYRHCRLLCLAPIGLLGACSSVSMPDIPLPSFIKPYRMEIQQGNFVTQEMLSQLRPGMTRDQVKFVMGSPLITDMFHASRWDYIFNRQLEFSKGIEKRNLTIFFVDGKLQRIDGDVVPAVSTPAMAATPGVDSSVPGVVVTPVPAPYAPTLLGTPAAAQTPEVAPK